jgi:AraC-like DNA-binding protein
MSVKSIKQEINESNIAQLEQVRDITDSRLGELRNIGMRIAIDDRFSPNLLEHQPYKAKEAIKELNTYQMGSSVIDSLVLRYQLNEFIYSSQGTGTMDNFTSNVYHFPEKEIEKLEQKLLASTEPQVFPVQLDSSRQQEDQLITYVYPLSPENSLSAGQVLFFIKPSVIRKLTENVLGDFDGNSYIFNTDQEILVANHKGGPLKQANMASFADLQPGISSQNINGKAYSVVAVTSEVTDWTFVTAVPTAQFYSKLSALKTFLVTLLSVIALVSICLTIYLSTRHYRPIHHLTQLITKKQYNPVAGNGKNELENIKVTLENVFAVSENLQTQVNVQQPFVRDQLLLNLLRNKNEKQPEAMKQHLKNMDLDLSDDYYFVVMIVFHDTLTEDSLKDREEILQLLSSIQTDGVRGYGVELIHDHAVALIVNQNQEHNALQQQFITHITNELHDLNPIWPTIGVGNIYKGIERINKSFIEASAAADSLLAGSNGEVIYFESITCSTANTFWYPMDKQAQFVQSLKQGDKVIANEALDDILTDLQEKDISGYLLKSLCFDIVNTLLKNISDLRMLHRVEDVQQIVAFKTVEDLREKGQTLIIEICNEVERRKESHNHSLRNEMLTYIQAHYTQFDLSLESIAETFQLSVSYLSRFIKEQTGETFTQYVWRLRNDACKQQLRETDMPIKEIVTKIGYRDVANFTRKFKKEEGLTPGQYRIQYAEKKVEAL